MKKTILFFAAFAALLSCTKDNLSDKTQSAESFSITLEAAAPSTSGDATKTTLVAGDENTQLVHWTKGDAIKVGFIPVSGYGSLVDNMVGVFNSSFEEESTASAQFSIQNWDWQYQYGKYDSGAYGEIGLAMYPEDVQFESFRAVNTTAPVQTDISYTLPSEQMAVENSFESGLCFSYAEVKKSEFLTGFANANFNNACALLKITLPSEAENIVSVNVTSLSDTPLTGKFEVPYASLMNANNYDYNSLTFPLELEATEGMSSVTIKAPENEVLKAGSSYYMVVWPGAHSAGLRFTFTNSDEVICQKGILDNVVLEASKIDEFVFKSISFEKEISYDDAQVGDYFYLDGTFSKNYDTTKDLAGIVFYVGDPTEQDSTLGNSEYSGCTHGLVVAVEAEFEVVLKLCTKNGLWNENGTYLETRGVKSGGTTRNDPYSNYKTGYNNTMALKSFDPGSPAIEYCADMPGVNGASCWFMPTIAEFDVLYDNYDVVCASLASIGKISYPRSKYWTVSEEDGTYVAIYKLDSKGVEGIKKSPLSGHSLYILPIFAF